MSAQFMLSAFGDEIADDLNIQLETLGQLKIRHLELRGVWGKNVLELNDDEISRIGEQCERNGIGISAVGSPIGKSPLDESAVRELQNLQRAFEIGSTLGVHQIRVFSFYPPVTTPASEFDRYVNAAEGRLSTMATLAAREGFTLLLENEKDIVGDTIARCHALLKAVASPSLRFAWDPANFVQVGELAPTVGGWPILGPYVAHVHVKDALATGTVTPAGFGDGQVGLLLDGLRESEYSGFLALEPHLEIAGHSSGFSGVEGMARAVSALRNLMSEHHCEET